MNRVRAHHWIKGIVLTVLILGLAGTGYWLGRDSVSSKAAGDAPATTEEAAAPVATVTTQPLEAGIIEQTIEAYGVVQNAPGSSMNVSVPFESRVLRVLATPGAAVDADTEVIEVGPTEDVALQLRQATEAQTAAEHNLEMVRKRLLENLATNAELATAEQAVQGARTQMESLQKRGAGKAHMLTAGTAGVVAQVNVQPGQIAAAGASLLVISPQTSIEAVVGVEPSDAALLQPGAPVNVRDVQGTAEAQATVGTIRLIAQQINPQTRLREVSITLTAETQVLQGQFVIAELTTRAANGLIVPRSAVLPDDEDHVVFTVADGKAKRHAVQVGLSNHEQMQVTSDELHQGDAIIVTGNAELEDGMAVTIAPPTTQPAAPEEKK